ncbi:uncharacterized protein LOC114074378 [Solanum pennellii]|uniref:Uncharacterized protein LOC114074378 n=1 Tax=Solanum pennellii TaxID=28526 RepID=A0ABM1UX69_SOLPN|nr:uncharacterized protein LOC114074378 [Solanum pennellii]XP_027768091.1 uncharacterized protein LOC114074378 [Solanum pennellii]XP_027768093.1 uncharacterized protein LOC114074378 [Solanum pennellii]XP_027768096.1 uncharacterized protein LOC114074378 [Solanum pennellii]
MDLLASDGKGFEVYLVGGCVSDLILDRTPKEFYILTSAELKEIRQEFEGKKAVNLVFSRNIFSSNQVSSFTATGSKFERNVYNVVRRPACSEADFIHWKNRVAFFFFLLELYFNFINIKIVLICCYPKLIA